MLAQIAAVDRIVGEAVDLKLLGIFNELADSLLSAEFLRLVKLSRGK